jgi:hypothetical protein
MSLEDDIERDIAREHTFDSIYEQVRLDRTARDQSRREAKFKLLPIDHPHAFAEFKSALGNALPAPTGAVDWRERVLEIIAAKQRETDDLRSQLIEIKDLLTGGTMGDILDVLNQPITAPDPMGFWAMNNDLKEARIIFNQKQGVNHDNGGTRKPSS